MFQLFDRSLNPAAFGSEMFFHCPSVTEWHSYSTLLRLNWTRWIVLRLGNNLLITWSLITSFQLDMYLLPLCECVYVHVCESVYIVFVLISLRYVNLFFFFAFFFVMKAGRLGRVIWLWCCCWLHSQWLINRRSFHPMSCSYQHSTKRLLKVY